MQDFRKALKSWIYRDSLDSLVRHQEVKDFLSLLFERLITVRKFFSAVVIMIDAQLKSARDHDYSRGGNDWGKVFDNWSRYLPFSLQCDREDMSRTLESLILRSPRNNQILDLSEDGLQSLLQNMQHVCICTFYD